MANTKPEEYTAIAPESIEIKLRHYDEPLALRYPGNSTKISIRTGADDNKLRNIIDNILGLALPQLGEAVSSDNLSILSTGPDEWLVITLPANHQTLLDALEREVTDGHFLACFDASSATTSLQLDGQAAAYIFSILTEANLTPEIFPVNTCKCIYFAQCTAIVHRININVYNIYIPRSYVSWVWNRILTIT